MAEMKLTPTTKDRIMYLFLYENKTRKELAQMFSVDRSTISRTLNDPKRIERFGKKIESASALSRLMVDAAALKAAEKQIEILNMEITDKNIYAVQNAARDILDRAGIKYQENAGSIVLSFAGAAPTIGMPPDVPEEAEPETVSTATLGVN